MSYSSQQASLSRAPRWLVKVLLDQCGNTHAASPCTASGTPCYYTYATCQDKANYLKGAATSWQFCSRELLLAGYLPYVKKVSYLPVEIDPEYCLALRGECKIELADDKPLPVSCPGKSVVNAETAGSFWKNLLARNPNYQRRTVEVYQGFAGLAASEYELYFSGLIESIEYKNFGVTITVKDTLRELKKLSHRQTSENCTCQANYTGGANFKCYYGNELPSHGIIKSPAGKYVKYDGATAGAGGVWTLGNAAFCFGSSGTISAGAVMRNVLVYANDDSAIHDGLPLDMILLDLLLTRARIDHSRITLVDSGATLDEDSNSSDTTISVSDSSLFPQDGGVVVIGDEWIIYRGITGGDLDTNKGHAIPLFYRHLRGAFRTTAAARSIGEKVYIPTLTNHRLGWLAGVLLRAEIVEPVKCGELVSQVCDQSLTQVFVDEDGKIVFNPIAPPLPSLAVADITEAGHCVDRSVFYKDDLEQQFTRVIVYYNPTEFDSEKKREFANAQAEIDYDIEGENYLGDEKSQSIKANWIWRSTEATSLASRTLLRYKNGARLLDFKLELKDASLMLGDLFWLDTGIVVDTDGARHDRLLCQVLKKERDSDGTIKIHAIETKLNRKYAYVGPENPTLETTINNSDTSVILQLTATSYQNTDFADVGQIRIGDEVITWVSKSYNAGTLKLTLTCTGGRGALGTVAAGHTAGDSVLLLYYGASATAQDNYAWIGDANNLLDSDGDGVADEEGYYVY